MKPNIPPRPLPHRALLPGEVLWVIIDVMLWQLSLKAETLKPVKSQEVDLIALKQTSYYCFLLQIWMFCGSQFYILLHMTGNLTAVYQYPTVHIRVYNNVYLVSIFFMCKLQMGLL